jgi:fatty acid desaturase
MQVTPDLPLTDPVWQPDMAQGPFARLVRPLLREERDVGIVRTMLLVFLGVVVPGLVLFVPGLFRWWMAPIYWFLYIRFIGPYTLMLHCVCHRKIFRRDLDWMHHLVSWVLGPFLGHTPDSYYVHHIGMHHVEGNLPGDLSSTMKYQRDSFRDFLKYEVDFFFLGVIKLFRYFQTRGRKKLARRLFVGEAFFLALAAAATIWNPPAGLTVFVVPFLVTRILLMMGNWAQHAFVDPDEPANDYCTVVAFVNSDYNQRSFNDGYHLTHHLVPHLHYLDMPADFLSRREEMIRKDSLVFRKIDYFGMFLLLMTKQHRKLASYHVELDPEHPRSEDEIVALIQRRLRRFEPEALARL